MAGRILILQNKGGVNSMTIRYAKKSDLDAITAVEAACFPAAEGATNAEFAERRKYYGNHFWLMIDKEKLI